MNLCSQLCGQPHSQLFRATFSRPPNLQVLQFAHQRQHFTKSQLFSFSLQGLRRQCRKKFFNEQAKNLEKEMLIRLCHICSKVDRFTSALHRFLHRRCSKCGHEFGDFIPKTVLDTAAFGKAAPVTSPQKHLNKRSNMELEVLAATYGIARYPPGTIDVTEEVRNIINESSRKMLLLEKGTNIMKKLNI